MKDCIPFEFWPLSVKGAWLALKACAVNGIRAWVGNHQLIMAGGLGSSVCRPLIDLAQVYVSSLLAV